MATGGAPAGSGAAGSVRGPGPPSSPAMTIALLTNHLVAYRMPLYERLAAEFDVEVLCYGGGERYVPSWVPGLDEQLSSAPFPARRLEGIVEALEIGRAY